MRRACSFSLKIKSIALYLFSAGQSFCFEWSFICTGKILLLRMKTQQQQAYVLTHEPLLAFKHSCYQSSTSSCSTTSYSSPVSPFLASWLHFTACTQGLAQIKCMCHLSAGSDQLRLLSLKDHPWSMFEVCQLIFALGSFLPLKFYVSACIPPKGKPVFLNFRGTSF